MLIFLVNGVSAACCTQQYIMYNEFDYLFCSVLKICNFSSEPYSISIIVKDKQFWDENKCLKFPNKMFRRPCIHYLKISETI